ncbi:hypothetical protein HCN44_007053 [Aphidius gifuensis]|uniref:BEN domain-containing protein n=1 Tax=Aphidius gifuensis TaxID=684658 RepID=A0A834Y0Z7_APHGI|nr:hypothetical protein HCN44_007053 [Aphidius gifuensis]
MINNKKKSKIKSKEIPLNNNYNDDIQQQNKFKINSNDNDNEDDVQQQKKSKIKSKEIPLINNYNDDIQQQNKSKINSNDNDNEDNVQQKKSFGIKNREISATVEVNINKQTAHEKLDLDDDYDLVENDEHNSNFEKGSNSGASPTFSINDIYITDDMIRIQEQYLNYLKYKKLCQDEESMNINHNGIMKKSITIPKWKKVDSSKKELISGKGVWISISGLEEYEEVSKNDPARLVRLILKDLIGTNTLKNLSALGTRNRPGIDNDVRETLQKYIQQKFFPGKKPWPQFNETINQMCQNIRSDHKKTTKRPNQNQKESTSSEVEIDNKESNDNKTISSLKKASSHSTPLITLVRRISNGYAAHLPTFSRSGGQSTTKFNPSKSVNSSISNKPVVINTKQSTNSGPLEVSTSVISPFKTQPVINSSISNKPVDINTKQKLTEQIKLLNELCNIKQLLIELKTLNSNFAEVSTDERKIMIATQLFSKND